MSAVAARSRIKGTDLKALARVPDGESHAHGHMEHAHPGIYHAVFEHKHGESDANGGPEHLHLQHREVGS